MSEVQNSSPADVRGGLGHILSSRAGCWTKTAWGRTVLVAVVGVACVSAVAQTAPAACSDSVFGSSAECQQTQQVQQTGVGSAQDPQTGVGSTGAATQVQRQPGNAPVYVDSAGVETQRDPNQMNRSRSFFPPDPVTDLQRLARSSTGESIPIFGRDFFQTPPSTFAPGNNLPITPDYVLGPGDQVLVRIFGGEASSGNSALTVDNAGDIYLPRVGTVHVAGLRADQLQSEVKTAVNRVFRNYSISVSLGQLRSIQVYLVGEARRPGAYTVSGLSTVLNALFASGGPNVQGSLRHIQVRRGGQTLPEFDLYDLVLRGDKSRDVRLESGDTIFIPPVGPQVAVAGSVRHPAIYELKDTTTLEDVLTLAGGFSATGAPGQVSLERIDTDLRRHAVTVALSDAGRAMALRDGDVVYAGHISPAYERSVTIRGNLANPGRFKWVPGMRLNDIVPDRSSLLTNNYWRERNRLGVPVPLFEPLPAQQDFERYGEYGRQPYDQRTARQGNRSAMTGDDQQQNDGGLQTQNQQNQQNQQQRSNVTVAEQTAGLATGGVVSSLDAANDRAARTETLLNDSRDPQEARERQQEANLPTNRVRIPAPEIDWSYAVIERLDPQTLKNSLVPFNLGRLVQDHDATQNLELQPGDIVTIFSQHDILVPQHEQTKFVRLEGEFAGAGVYSVGPGETLDQLVRRAGGFTPQSYLYGSSFQRESARQFQQQRLNEYITQLSADLERESAVRAASSITGITNPNALLEERERIGQLRQLRATGRVVLEFKPSDTGVESVPTIPLENGDVFRVPPRPNTVSVIGAVYGQNVFLFNPSRHLADYLALAGKPNRIADKSHAFIIRADGSVYSRELAKGVLSNHFDDSHIYPGDAIVIPEKPVRPTTLKQVTDYSQILSSFGLAAAAINVVR